MEDQQIIQLFFARSEHAITELSQKYGRLCHALARRILNDEQDAAECVNDAYLALWNTIPPQEPDPLSAYLCRITRNLALKKYHANTARKRNHYYDAVLEEIADVLESTESVEETILVQELSAKINQFLAQAKRTDRIIFLQRYWFCDSIPSIAKRFGMTPNSVKVNLCRTRKKLKNYLKEEGFL